MNNKRGFIVSLIVLVIIVWASFTVVQSVKNLEESALRPVNAISTQAAQLFNPTPTILPDPITMILEVQSLARLETIHYSMEKIITAEVNSGVFSFLVGDKLLFVAHGEVIAGVDLSKLDEEDIYIEEGILYVRLPEAEIFVTTLDNEKSYVYDRETGIFKKGEKDLESAARLAAEEEIEKAALEDGILEQAQLNAENYLARLFRSLGFPEVVFLEAEE